MLLLPEGLIIQAINVLKGYIPQSSKGVHSRVETKTVDGNNKVFTYSIEFIFCFPLINLQPCPLFPFLPPRYY